MNSFVFYYLNCAPQLLHFLVPGSWIVPQYLHEVELEGIGPLVEVDEVVDVEDFLEDEDKKYFVLYTGDEYKTTEDYELVFQNEAGVILKKIVNE